MTIEPDVHGDRLNSAARTADATIDRAGGAELEREIAEIGACPLQLLAQGFTGALADEMAAASAATIRLGPGRRLATTRAGATYRFTAPHAVVCSRNDRVLLRIDDDEIAGRVIAIGRRHVDLSLDVDDGEALPPGAELLLDPPWLLARLAERVEDICADPRRRKRQYHVENALRVLGLAPIAVSTQEPPFTAPAELNEAQAAALSLAFRSPVSVIAAPAGTGKTRTLAALVSLAANPQQSGSALRVLLVAPSNAAVDVLMMAVCRRVEDQDVFRRGAILRVGDDAGLKLRHQYGSMVMVDDVLARVEPALAAQIARCESAVDEALDALEQARTSADRRSADLADMAVDHARCRLQQAYAARRAARQRLIVDARVVGATLARAVLDGPALGDFDIVVVDEASMAQLPAVFAVAAMAKRQVVLAGDPAQLAPPVRNTGPRRAVLTEDVFQRLGVTEAIAQGDELPFLTMLTEQHRCAETLCALHRTFWYGEHLRTAPSVFKREAARHNVIFGTEALCWLDTSPLNPTTVHQGSTFANRTHASLVRDLVAYIESGGELSTGQDDAVLVLAPYRGQVALLREMLEPYRLNGVRVRTIHGAQGAEAATAILDLTLAGHLSHTASGLLTALGPYEEGSRLLAVASSRARSRLIVVGDGRWITRYARPRSVLARFHAYLRTNAYEIPLREVQPGVHLLRAAS